ncbi:homoserine kinase [Polycladomyces sp. WAk]|uniref:Homoserine kinase n=1 Tax=Polycladomyces zharkentensis TaxID=2807616 RepID=A0ABS2WKQ3_9BACL|nr:homoserine kinase [Polycladomyces sp. WAk]MBN2910147.1 homoserine kinase [Polycladomyces sp. WAk]
MCEHKVVEIAVPASTANLGPGFDSIGMALNRFLRIRAYPAERTELELIGPHLQGLPQDGRNFLLQVVEDAFRSVGQTAPPLHIQAESDIPLMRGMGSSASAIIAGLLLANHLLGEPWDREEILLKATKREGHPDNVGASLLGGVVIGSWDGERVDVVQAPCPGWDVVAAIPAYPLPTSRARQVLPPELPHDEAVLASSRANLLTAAFFTGKWELLQTAMRDRFHQPYRASLIPGMERVLREAPQNGAWGAALSGAGPTVIAFARETEPLVAFMREVFGQEGTSVRIEVLKPWPDGATVRLTTFKKWGTFMGNI